MAKFQEKASQDIQQVNQNLEQNQTISQNFKPQMIQNSSEQTTLKKSQSSHNFKKSTNINLKKNHNYKQNHYQSIQHTQEDSITDDDEEKRLLEERQQRFATEGSTSPKKDEKLIKQNCESHKQLSIQDNVSFGPSYVPRDAGMCQECGGASAIRRQLVTTSTVTVISVRSSDYEANILYLIALTLTAGFSSLQFVLAMSASGPAIVALKYQFKWDKQLIGFYSTVLCTSSIAGISVGALYGGDFMRHGRRRSLIQMNWVGLIGSLLSLVLDFKVMVLGRFVFGFASGVLLCVAPRILQETIPAKLMDKGFGASTNIILNLCGFCMLVMAMGMPEEQTKLKETYFWCIFFAISIPFQVAAIILHTFYFKEETLEFSVNNGDKQQALSLISKVFSSEDAYTHELIYKEQLRIAVARNPSLATQQPGSEQTLSGDQTLWHALTSPNQRNASWLSVFLAAFNNLSGIGIISIYATSIFESILSNHKDKSRMTAKEDAYFLGLAGLIGAILSFYSVAIFSRRTLFIGGHFFMGVLLLMSAYFIQKQLVELVLLSLGAFVVIFQATQGTILFLYINEIVSNDSVLGLCLFLLMFMLTLESVATPVIVNSKLGVAGLFYVLGFFQAIVVIFLVFYLKETQNLNPQQRKSLYSQQTQEQKITFGKGI